MPSATVNEPASGVSRLAIWHVLLWTACVSAVAAWHGTSLAPPSASWQIQLHQQAARLSYSVLAGMALTGLVLALGRAVKRRGGYPATAGHWLLTAAGAVTLLSEASNALTDAWHRANPGMQQSDAYAQVSVYSFALMTMLYVACATAVRESWPWRLVFLGYAMPTLFWSITNGIRIFGDPDKGEQWSKIGYGLQGPWQWLMAVVVVSLAGFDLVQRRRSDWLHWTGIGYVVGWVCSESILQTLHAWSSQ